MANDQNHMGHFDMRSAPGWSLWKFGCDTNNCTRCIVVINFKDFFENEENLIFSGWFVCFKQFHVDMVIFHIICNWLNRFLDFHLGCIGSGFSPLQIVGCSSAVRFFVLLTPDLPSYHESEWLWHAFMAMAHFGLPLLLEFNLTRVS